MVTNVKYVYLENKTVSEIIPEFDQVFPDVSITERYDPDFVDKLLCLDDGVAVEQNWVYDPDTNTFSPPPEPEPILQEAKPEPGLPTPRRPPNRPGSRHAGGDVPCMSSSASSISSASLPPNK